MRFRLCRSTTLHIDHLILRCALEEGIPYMHSMGTGCYTPYDTPHGTIRAPLPCCNIWQIIYLFADKHHTSHYSKKKHRTQITNYTTRAGSASWKQSEFGSQQRLTATPLCSSATRLLSKKLITNTY
jgi:hypothetical protein